MFNMMIYMHKKVGSYEQARKTFALMVELGIQQTTEVAERLWTGWEDERIEKNENIFWASLFNLKSLYIMLQDQDLDASNFVQLRKALMQYFRPSSFVREHTKNKPEEHVSSSLVHGSQMDSNMIKFYDKNPRAQHESYVSALWKLRDQSFSFAATDEEDSTLAGEEPL
ncbi:hypothetical protein JHK87_012298 [Glycine soja]|nr:hypothetical protein JHK87_012298 [Glycine soja]